MPSRVCEVEVAEPPKSLNPKKYQSRLFTSMFSLEARERFSASHTAFWRPESKIKLCPSEVSKALRDDVEALGTVPWEDIKNAQQQVRNILRGLVTLGKVKFK